MPRVGVATLLLGLGALASQGAAAQSLGRRGAVGCGTLGTTCCIAPGEAACADGLECAAGGILQNICITPPRRLPALEVGETTVEERGPPATGGGDGVVREEVALVVEDAPDVPEPEPEPEPMPEPMPMPEPRPARRPRASPPVDSEPMPEPESMPEEEPEEEPEEPEEEREVNRDIQVGSVVAGERPPDDEAEPVPAPLPPPARAARAPMRAPAPAPEPEEEEVTDADVDEEDDEEEDEEEQEEEEEREVDRDVQVGSVTAGERPPDGSRAAFEDDEAETTVEETRFDDGTRNVAAVRITSSS